MPSIVNKIISQRCVRYTREEGVSSFLSITWILNFYFTVNLFVSFPPLFMQRLVATNTSSIGVSRVMNCCTGSVKQLMKKRTQNA